MSIFSFYIVSKSGGMIFNYDHNYPKIETERTYTFPMELKLEVRNKKLVVIFGGGKDSIPAGQSLTAVNGKPVLEGPQFEDGASVVEYLANDKNYPINLKFGRTRMSTNEKMFLGSMFYPLYAIASQISPELHCSGIQMLEAESFKLHCMQTLTGIKFILIADPKLLGIDSILRRVYELYSDYVLKNPFYALEMPIRCELFLGNLKLLFESAERLGI